MEQHHRGHATAQPQEKQQTKQVMWPLRSATLVLVALCITGCYESDELFLNTDNAETPLPPGSYSEILVDDKGEPEKVDGEADLKILGNSYLVTDNGHKARWYFIPISSGLYVFEGEPFEGQKPNDKYLSIIGSVSSNRRHVCGRVALENTPGVESDIGTTRITDKTKFLAFIKSRVAAYLAAPIFGCLVPRFGPP